MFCPIEVRQTSIRRQVTGSRPKLILANSTRIAPLWQPSGSSKNIAAFDFVISPLITFALGNVSTGSRRKIFIRGTTASENGNIRERSCDVKTKRLDLPIKNRRFLRRSRRFVFTLRDLARDCAMTCILRIRSGHCNFMTGPVIS